MTPPFDLLHRLFDLGLLRGASLLVPGQQRAEWWREWHAELWHVRQACTQVGMVSRQGERKISAFCRGAFQDALCLRRQCRQPQSLLTTWQGSAAQCTLFLAALLIATYALALLLPRVRAERNLTPLQLSPGLVLIQALGEDDDSSPTITPRRFQQWKAQKQQYFDGFAFYRITQELVTTGSRAEAGWGVASASPNMFVLLGLPVMFAETEVKAESDIPNLILSEAAWKRDFGGNAHVAGSIVRVGLREAKVAGVVPDGSWGLPGKIDAWLLQPDSAFFSNRAGYAVAHLTTVGRIAMWRPRVAMTPYRPGQLDNSLLLIALDKVTPGQWPVFLFAVFLAFLALPATTSVSLGDCSLSPKKTSWSRRLYRWSFLCAKATLLLPIVYFASLDLTYGARAFDSTTALYIQLVSSFSICLFGLRWVVRDQRRRCPVCLRRVEHPAQVGYASRTFLGWNGTEMICMSGHTLLHVPEMPTSWFDTQRWLYLDTSWGFLFTGTDIRT